jgi:hypothetical protein
MSACSRAEAERPISQAVSSSPILVVKRRGRKPEKVAWAAMAYKRLDTVRSEAALCRCCCLLSCPWERFPKTHDALSLVCPGLARGRLGQAGWLGSPSERWVLRSPSAARESVAPSNLQWTPFPTRMISVPYTRSSAISNFPPSSDYLTGADVLELPVA